MEIKAACWAPFSNLHSNLISAFGSSISRGTSRLAVNASHFPLPGCSVLATLIHFSFARMARMKNSFWDSLHFAVNCPWTAAPSRFFNLKTWKIQIILSGEANCKRTFAWGSPGDFSLRHGSPSNSPAVKAFRGPHLEFAVDNVQGIFNPG